MGDGLLVEFASVVDALTCAVAWQNGVAGLETAAGEDKRLTFRKPHLGSVIRSKKRAFLVLGSELCNRLQ